jgi:NAD(P)H-flavin reductase/ferredoxin
MDAMRPSRTASAATITLDGRRFDAAPGETLLDAAQRAGVALPFSCRVGGCGTCRCRVLEGTVRERTESAYLLSDAEISTGVVLACQSVPRGTVRIARVDAPAAAARRVGGAVVAQARLAPGVVRVEVQLDQGLPYAAGQHALLRLADRPEVARPYSFATPVRTDGRVSFIVRQHAGGALSARLCTEDLRGRAVQVEGPFGDLTLREGAASWLFVATGTGLSPILALLQEALDRGIARPAAVVIGARTCADLFAREDLDAIAARWPGGLRVVPVLSRADDGWDGARGRVTDHLATLLPDDAEAWLCGAPAMVDDAGALLRALGVPASRVHADRFTPATPDPAPAAAVHAADGGAATAGWCDYLKFSLFHLVGLVALASLLAGGGWTVAGLLGTVGFYVLGDILLGDDLRSPRYRHPGLLTAQLWLALPLLAAIVFAAVWTVAPGDPLGLGAWLQSVTGRDALAARDASGFGTHLAGWLLTGLMIGMVGTVPAHELVHRTWDRASLAIGRWLLAFSFDTAFSVEHVHGHHRHVATPIDPASAPRGRNVYAHILHSTLAGNRSAWRIEARRLRARGHGVWSWRNVVLRGHAMEVFLLAAAFTVGGAAGAAFFALCALWGKALLEIVNYMEHYGIAREPGTPVAPRHSWNTNRRISSWSMFNLTRHSHHHAQGEAPFHALQPFADAPQMPTGYLGTILLALVPPLWRRVMAPRLADWDARFATPAERLLVAEAARAAVDAPRPERPIAA